MKENEELSFPEAVLSSSFLRRKGKEKKEKQPQPPFGRYTKKRFPGEEMSNGKSLDVGWPTDISSRPNKDSIRWAAAQH